MFRTEAHVRAAAEVVCTDLVATQLKEEQIRVTDLCAQIQQAARTVADVEAQILPTIPATHAVLMGALDRCVDGVLAEARTALAATATVRQGLRLALAEVLLAGLPVQVRLHAPREADVDLRRLIRAGLRDALHALKTQARSLA